MNLEDSFGRKFDYLRISLTDRCNLRCFYCMPERGIKLFNKKEILTLEEIENLVFFFYKNFGIKKVRLTGGEPLLRREFENLVRNIKKNLPEIDLNITTNGILLKEKSEFLKEKGIKVNVSLDTLNREKFQKITGFDYLGKVIEGIDYALSFKIPLKINTVVLKTINEDEILDLIEFSCKRNIILRFIEYMPLSENGNWRKYFVPEKDIKNKIKEKYDLVPYENGKIAKNYKVFYKDFIIGEIGFISTISDPFCSYCSRLRITSDGNVVLCLLDEKGYNIKKFLRPFIEEKLIDFIKNIVELKPEGYIKFKRESTYPEKYYAMRKIGG